MQGDSPHPRFREVLSAVIKVQAPVLQLYGPKDQYLLAVGISNKWEWFENRWTLLILASADPFVQHDAAGLLTRMILKWLTSVQQSAKTDGLSQR